MIHLSVHNCQARDWICQFVSGYFWLIAASAAGGLVFEPPTASTFIIIISSSSNSSVRYQQSFVDSEHSGRKKFCLFRRHCWLSDDEFLFSRNEISGFCFGTEKTLLSLLNLFSTLKPWTIARVPEVKFKNCCRLRQDSSRLFLRKNSSNIR